MCLVAVGAIFPLIILEFLFL